MSGAGDRFNRLSWGGVLLRLKSDESLALSPHRGKRLRRGCPLKLLPGGQGQITFAGPLFFVIQNGIISLPSGFACLAGIAHILGSGF